VILADALVTVTAVRVRCVRQIRSSQVRRQFDRPGRRTVATTAHRGRCCDRTRGSPRRGVEVHLGELFGYCIPEVALPSDRQDRTADPVSEGQTVLFEVGLAGPAWTSSFDRTSTRLYGPDPSQSVPEHRLANSRHRTTSQVTGHLDGRHRGP
jgi:hypothetical protein